MFIVAPSVPASTAACTSGVRQRRALVVEELVIEAHEVRSSLGRSFRILGPPTSGRVSVAHRVLLREIKRRDLARGVTEATIGSCAAPARLRAGAAVRRQAAAAPTARTRVRPCGGGRSGRRRARPAAHDVARPCRLGCPTPVRKESAEQQLEPTLVKGQESATPLGRQLNRRRYTGL